ncbi:hypothetical protein HS048_28475 [Planomonospora sp. ID91781]|uniref:hypothetical protein n=1 Tax=Planomonospora sp. ID91781 TaxID=2738135 RepID=UPI0018C43B2F|nr:hypothetical protein [Planomonospora sp. ID91781]MBG0824647.1 hypothetical protein [Planomonospora sp. ID91781]
MRGHGLGRVVAAVCLAGALTGCGVIGTVGRAAEEAMADPAVITEDAPFKGSPSEGFAEGIAGIEVPEAEAVGRFPAKDVRAAYKVSRSLLEAAYLDEQSLLSAAPGRDKEVGPLLVVTYEARFVYAVRPAGKTGPIVRVMAYTKSRHEFWRDEPGGRLRHWEGDSVDGWNAGVECDSTGRFHRPDFRSEGGGDGPLQDAYADGEAPMKEGECGSVEEI